MKNCFLITTFIVTQYSFADKLKFPNSFESQNQTITFTENKGQVHDQNYQPRPDVLFYGSTNGMVYHIKNSGVSYQLSRIDSWKENENLNAKNRAMLNARSGSNHKPKLSPDQITIYRVDINWLNTNKNIVIEKGTTLPSFDNFYTAGSPEGGALNVKSFSDVTLKNIYKGIDVHYYEKNGQLEYDYIVAPGADHKQIQFNIEGAEGVSVNNKGELVIKTPLGEIIEQAPVVKQKQNILPSKWVVKNKTVSFKVDNVNPKQILTIDPAVVVRAWGTYCGGYQNENGIFNSVDILGNVYISGQTNSTNSGLIATNGSHQSTLMGSSDVFLVKYDPNSVRMWGTYYGGPTDELNACSTTDPSGNVFLFGTTGSTIAIATNGSYQSSLANGSADAFLVKFNQYGVRQWGTYYGGNANENGWYCTSDQQGNIYLNGYVDGNSGSALTSIGCHQPSFGGGQIDLFIAKFNTNGIRLWGSYYGGNLSEGFSKGVADLFGNFYIAGKTSSQNGTSIATFGSHQPSHGDNINFSANNAFLVKFNSNGVRQWGTYYGGYIGSGCGGCAVDGNGDVYLGGDTGDSLVITTPGCHQSSLFQFSGFLAKFNSNGVRQWGTYYGTENGGSSIESCATDNLNNIYVLGNTSQGIPSFISTSGSHQPNYGGGIRDGFVAKFNASGARQWGTFYGGNGDDNAWDIKIGPMGKGVYISGETNSTNGIAIATNNSQQPNYFDNGDAFLVKLIECSNSMATDCVGIEELNNEFIKLSIFPNPNNGEFTIKSEEDLKLNIINELGEVLQTMDLNDKNNHISNVINLNSGIYFLSSTNGLVKEKIAVIR